MGDLVAFEDDMNLVFSSIELLRPVLDGCGDLDREFWNGYERPLRPDALGRCHTLNRSGKYLHWLFCLSTRPFCIFVDRRFQKCVTSFFCPRNASGHTVVLFFVVVEFGSVTDARWVPGVARADGMLDELCASATELIPTAIDLRLARDHYSLSGGVPSHDHIQSSRSYWRGNTVEGLRSIACREEIYTCTHLRDVG